MPGLTFDGWWGDEDKQDAPEPWERFHVVLWAEEAGDWIDDPEHVQKVVALAGYRLVLEKIE